MTFMAINMTVQNRRDFGAIAMLLHMVLAAAGAALIWSYFIIRNLLEELHGLLHQHYGTVYVESVLLVGAIMIFIHGYGVKMCLHVGNWKKLYHKAFSWKVMMYMFLTVTLILMTGVVAFLVVTAQQDSTAIVAGTNAMSQAIAQYKTNIVMKTAVDRVQLQNECCGAVTYTEWFKQPWIDNAYIPRNAPADATKYAFPFSCCNRHSERPCINVDVNNERAHYKYNPSTDVTVYRVGCNLGVTRVLREVVFANLRFYGWIAFVLELLAFLLFRYVQTSTDVALTWADPTLICPGYLFNIGPPAVPLSKTTNIEEFRRRQERLEETIAMDEDMNLKGGEDEEEPVSRWHKGKKKKKQQNQSTNNWNNNEQRSEGEVIYANTGYSSNNNSATSGDNSDNETMLMLMPDAVRRATRRQQRRNNFRHRSNVTMSNRNVSEPSSRRSSISGSQPAVQDVAEEQQEDGINEEDANEYGNDDEEEEVTGDEADIVWENELQQDKSRRRSLNASANVAGKPPLPPSAQRQVSADESTPPAARTMASPEIVPATQPQADPVILGSPIDVQTTPVMTGPGNVGSFATPQHKDVASGVTPEPAAVHSPPQLDAGQDYPREYSSDAADYNQTSDSDAVQPDSFDQPYNDFEEQPMAMGGEEVDEPWAGGMEDGGVNPEKDAPGEEQKDEDKKRSRKRDKSRDGKNRDRKEDKHKKKDKDRKSSDRKRDKRKGSKDKKTGKDKKRKDRGRKSSKDRKGSDKKRRERSTSRDKKHSRDKKGSRERRRSKEKKGDRSKSRTKKKGEKKGDRSKSRDKKKGTGNRPDKEKKRKKSKDGRSSDGRKSKGRKKRSARKSGGRKSGGRSPGSRSSSRKKKKGGGKKSGRRKKGGRSPGSRSPGSAKLKRGLKKLRRR